MALNGAPVNNMDDLPFGAWVRERRTAMRLSQAKLGERSGCSPDAIRKIELGQRDPSVQLAQLLAEGLEIPSDEHSAFVRWARTGTRDVADIPPLPPSLSLHQSHSKLASLATSSGTSQHNKSSAAAQLTNPYKGLRVFSEDDAPYFFGREALVSRLLASLDAPGDSRRFMAVVGPSGCGKSSLVRAGLIPALRSRGVFDSSQVIVVSMVPGNSPREELRSALRLSLANRAGTQVVAEPPLSAHNIENSLDSDSALAKARPAQPARALSADSSWSLTEEIGQYYSFEDLSEKRILLFIDQFEEIFTLTEREAERAAFISELYMAATDPSSRIHVLVTLRADFYDRPLLYLNMSELFSEHTQLVGPMSPDEIHSAIVSPARKAGVAFEDGLESLIERDVAEQPGALPLLEYALTELFERREGRTLTLNAYRASGGVRQAIGGRAEAIFSELSDAEKEETRQLFLRLVALGETGEETRRRAPRAELASAARDEEAVEQVLEHFGRYRLLTFDRDPTTRNPTVEVAHEALIHNWTRFREWLDASKSDLRIHRQLASARHEWMAAGRDVSFLARGSRLAQFQALDESGDSAKVFLTSEEQEYLRASITQQLKERAAGRRRVKLSISGLATALVAISLIAIFAIAQASLATKQSQVAMSREIAAEALAQVKGDTMRSLLLAIEAARIAPTDEAGNAIRQALLELDPPRILYQGHEASGSMDFDPDSSRAVIAEHGIGSYAPPVRIRDMRTGDVVANLDHTGQVSTIQFSADGRFLGGGSRDHLVWLWNGSTGETLHTLAGHEASISSVAFSFDNKLIVSGSADNTARVWDVESGAQTAALLGHSAPVNSVQFSPDGNGVVTASDDKTARIWDARSGRQLHVLEGHQNIVNTAVFSPDGKWVLTASQDNTVRLWDAGTGKVVLNLTEHTDTVNNARFSPDGNWVATASNDGTTRLWNLEEMLSTPENGQDAASRSVLQSGPAMDARFSPDGKWIVSTCNSPGGDHLWVARVFDIETGKPVAELGGREQMSVIAYGRSYFASRFSPDGKWLMVADGHAVGRVLRWEIYQPLDYILKITSDYVTRQLTCEERETYLHEDSACTTAAPAANQ